MHFQFSFMIDSQALDNSEENLVTIAFYNLENLFDTKDDLTKIDGDFTPKGRFHWTQKRYNKKIKKMGRVIAQLGRQKTLKSPEIIGVVEVENSTVLNDLVHSKYLKNEHYGFVHHDSPDERGIDVALLYKKESFELLTSKTHSLMLEDDEGKRDFTRDVLYVKGKLNGELTHFFVNHWPSRRDGDSAIVKRVKAAQLVHSLTSEIIAQDSNAKIIIMGDFNDDPTSESVKKHLVGPHFYNAMESLFQKGKGTTTYNKQWNLFDQIIFSKNYLAKTQGSHTFKYAEVFDKDFLKVFKGKRKGSPFRTYIYKWYQGGYSDHFPVFAYLEKK